MCAQKRRGSRINRSSLATLVLPWSEATIPEHPANSAILVGRLTNVAVLPLVHVAYRNHVEGSLAEITPTISGKRCIVNGRQKRERRIVLGLRALRPLTWTKRASGAASARYGHPITSSPSRQRGTTQTFYVKAGGEIKSPAWCMPIGLLLRS